MELLIIAASGDHRSVGRTLYKGGTSGTVGRRHHPECKTPWEPWKSVGARGLDANALRLSPPHRIGASLSGRVAPPDHPLPSPWLQINQGDTAARPARDFRVFLLATDPLRQAHGHLRLRVRFLRRQRWFSRMAGDVKVSRGLAGIQCRNTSSVPGHPDSTNF